jgi:NADPH-dependent 2,4-dienoyl-CoA reductase/sulfur reductase-like enzyme
VNSPHRVVVVGGGFGGLQAALQLRRAPVELTLVDRRNFHLFQPLSYQVATGALSPGEIAYPLRAIFKRDPNVHVVMAEVSDFDLEARELHLSSVEGVPVPAAIPYDTLIVAGGSRYSYFGHDDWREHAFEVKSLESALTVRDRLLSAFEAAEMEPDPEARAAWLTFVVVGAGPTGVEMAGQIAELARDTLPAHGPHPARRGGGSCAHDLPARLVGEGRAIAAEARRQLAHAPNGGRYRRRERHDRRRERHVRAHSQPYRRVGGRGYRRRSRYPARGAHRRRTRPVRSRHGRA